MGLVLSELKNYLSNFTEDLVLEENSLGLALQGKFHFYAHYDDKLQKFYPFSPDSLHSNYLEDCYTIKVLFREGNFPVVSEVGERIANLAKEFSLADLHYPSEIACLGSPDKLYRFLRENLNNDLVIEFIQFYIIPFFYAQSFFSQKGKWPWKNLEHGVVGLFEEFSRDSNDLLFLHIIRYLNKNSQRTDLLNSRIAASIQDKLKQNKVKAHRSCICRSGRKFRNCHADALIGLEKFKHYIPNNAKLAYKYRGLLNTLK